MIRHEKSRGAVIHGPKLSLETLPCLSKQAKSFSLSRAHLNPKSSRFVIALASRFMETSPRRRRGLKYPKEWSCLHHMPASKPETPRVIWIIVYLLCTSHDARSMAKRSEREHVRQPARHRRDIKFHKAFCAEEIMLQRHDAWRAAQEEETCKRNLCCFVQLCSTCSPPPPPRGKQPICSLLSSVQLYQSTHQMHGAAAAAAVSKLNWKQIQSPLSRGHKSLSKRLLRFDLSRGLKSRFISRFVDLRPAHHG